MTRNVPANCQKSNAWLIVMFWLWLGLKAMALAFKNPKPGFGLSHGF
jgi:hypothetical protein